MNSQNQTISWADNRYSQLTGTRPWTERQVTFTTPSNAAKIRVYLEVDHKSPDASGEAWFDNVQLEEAQVSSSYNPVVNSSFEGTTTNWSGTGGSVDSTQSFDGGYSLKISRTSTTQSASEYKQTIIVGQTSGDAPINLTLTGVSKAENVKTNGTVSASDYSITAKVYFVDGTTQTYTADFPTGTQDWNRAAVSIQPSKPIDKIDISAVFRGNYTGTVWFDVIRLMEGNVVTKNKYDASGNYVTEEVDEEGYVAKKNYDAVGNLLSEYDKKGNKKEYTYDLSDRLKRLLLANGTSVNYDYDLNGNMTSKVIQTSGGQSQEFRYSYDKMGKLIKTVGPLNDVTTNEYDANGNRLEDGQYQYEWNAADQLVSITRKGESTPFVTYQYDEDGRRIQKNVNGVITNYHYQGDSLNVLYETDVDGNVVRSYIYGENGQLLAMKKGNTTYFYHYNAHGDVIALTDEQGNIVARYQYDAWGNILSQSGALADENPYRYAGYQYDKETGLYYLIARYYHPTHGVSLSLDPDPGDADDILTQNGYAYANNNPVMLVDPDGHYVQFIIWGYRGYKLYKGYQKYGSSPQVVLDHLR